MKQQKKISSKWKYFIVYKYTALSYTDFKEFFEDKYFGGLINIPPKIQKAIKKIRRLRDLYSDNLSE